MFYLIKESESLYAHNDISISIPIATHKVTLDGIRGDEEWQEAAKFNFSSARPCCEGNVSIFLQHELTENSLSGAFFIPDKTPINDSDQIAFLFDVNHSALNTINSDVQDLVFIRNGTSEFYVVVDSPADYVLGEHGTRSSTGYSHMRMPTSPETPFSSTDFYARNSNGSWQGEFKVYFKESPREDMGFSISQLDDKTPTNRSDGYFINYPKGNTSQANIPSSWGDIIYPPINKYKENQKFFCPKAVPSISENGVFILCSSLNMPSIEEYKDNNVVFVTGALANLISGRGISDNLTIDIIDSSGAPAAVTMDYQIKNDSNGKIQSELKTKTLRSGTYEIVLRPKSDQYGQIISTADLVVNPHTLTAQEFGTYIGIAATAIGIIAFLPQIRNHSKGKRQTRNMVKEMEEINAIFDRLQRGDSSHGQTPETSEIGKEKMELELRVKRDNALTMLQNDEINQQQFGLIDDKISEYTGKLGREKTSP